MAMMKKSLKILTAARMTLRKPPVTRQSYDADASSHDFPGAGAQMTAKPMMYARH